MTDQSNEERRSVLLLKAAELYLEMQTLKPRGFLENVFNPVGKLLRALNVPGAQLAKAEDIVRLWTGPEGYPPGSLARRVGNLIESEIEEGRIKAHSRHVIDAIISLLRQADELA